MRIDGSDLLVVLFPAVVFIMREILPRKIVFTVDGMFEDPVCRSRRVCTFDNHAPDIVFLQAETQLSISRFELIQRVAATSSYTCFKSMVIVTYSYCGPLCSVGLCHQLELSLSIANEIECFLSATKPLQTLHDEGLLSLQKVSSVPRNMVPQVALAEISAYGATSKMGGNR